MYMLDHTASALTDPKRVTAAAYESVVAETNSNAFCRLGAHHD